MTMRRCASMLHHNEYIAYYLLTMEIFDLSPFFFVRFCSCVAKSACIHAVNWMGGSNSKAKWRKCGSCFTLFFLCLISFFSVHLHSLDDSSRILHGWWVLAKWQKQEKVEKKNTTKWHIKYCVKNVTSEIKWFHIRKRQRESRINFWSD